VAWVSAPHASAVAQVTAVLQSPQVSGAVLAGPAGAGKTLLARTAAGAGTARIHTVTGTVPERMIPFGAFRGLSVRPRSGGRPKSFAPRAGR
jgi:type II secretory pathway predicted ATPase ExeA